MSYDSTFLGIVSRTLEAEGVLSDQAGDRGGLTKYGVTIPAMTEYLGRPATSADILGLTRDGAIDVYYKLYWMRPKFNTLPPALAEDVFDFAVNSGRSRAVMALQHMVGLAEDGNLGPATSAAVIAFCAKLGPRKFRNEYVIARGHFLMRAVQGDPSQLKFLDGWFERDVRKLDFAYGIDP